MTDTPFAETQIAADGRRYKTDDIETVNEQLAKGDSPKALEYTPSGEVAKTQEGSVAEGVPGDKLSADHASAPATAHASAATTGKADADEPKEHARRGHAAKEADDKS